MINLFIFSIKNNHMFNLPTGSVRNVCFPPTDFLG